MTFQISLAIQLTRLRSNQTTRHDASNKQMSHDEENQGDSMALLDLSSNSRTRESHIEALGERET